MEVTKRDIIRILVFMLAAMFVRLWFAGETDIAFGSADGPTRAYVAYNLLSDFQLIPHWVWLPLHFHLMALFMKIAGDAVVGARALSLVCAVLTIIPFYLLAKRAFSLHVALISTALLCFFPNHISVSATALSEAPYLLMVISSMLFLANYFITDAGKYLLISSVFLGLAALIRFEAWVMIPVFTLFVLINSFSWREVIKFLLPASVLVLLFIIPSWINMGNPFHGITTSDNTVRADTAGVQLDQVLSFFRDYFTTTFLWPTLFLLPFGLMLRRGAFFIIAIWAFFSFITLFKMVDFTLMPSDRYLVFVGALTLIILANGLVKILSRIGGPAWSDPVKILFVLGIVFFYMKMNLQQVQWAESLDRGFVEASNWIKENTEKQQKIIVDEVHFNDDLFALMTNRNLDQITFTIPDDELFHPEQFKKDLHDPVNEFMVLFPGGELNNYFLKNFDPRTGNLVDQQVKETFSLAGYHIYHIELRIKD